MTQEAETNLMSCVLTYTKSYKEVLVGVSVNIASVGPKYIIFTETFIDIVTQNWTMT
jgi:hypothetical protein